MKRDQKQEHADILEEMLQLTRSDFESSEELQELRDRAAAERTETELNILQAIAEQANVDLRPILEAERDARLERRRRIAETLARREAEASRRANQEKERFHRIRGKYRDEFEGLLAGPGGTTQLKFRDVISSSELVSPPKCTEMESSWWSGPSYDWLDSIVTADIVASTDTPGMWLHPKIDIRANGCNRMSRPVTFQTLYYRMDPPAVSFGVENVRVDLIATGIFSSHLGDPSGVLLKADPLWTHTHVTLKVVIGQIIDNHGYSWPLVSLPLFTAYGNVDGRQIRVLLSSETFPFNFHVLGTDRAGGDLFCVVTVICDTQPVGTGARHRLDFGAADGHGIFVGGVALIGASA
jgi:hypothetical protein